MVYAHCNNDECEKDQWWLKKPPSEYASGGPKCPECGTTRVSIDSQTQNDQSPSQSTEQPQQPTQAQPVAADREAQAQTPQTQQQAQQGGLPVDQEAVAAGEQVGNLVSSMSTSSPEEKAETQGKLLTAAGSTLASLGQRVAEKRMQDINRAKDSDGSNVGVVDDYINCPSCGVQITELPEPGTKFRCDGCGELLESQ